MIKFRRWLEYLRLREVIQPHTGVSIEANDSAPLAMSESGHKADMVMVEDSVRCSILSGRRWVVAFGIAEPADRAASRGLARQHSPETGCGQKVKLAGSRWKKG